MLVDVQPSDGHSNGLVIFTIRPQTQARAVNESHQFGIDGEISIKITATKVAHILAVLRGGNNPEKQERFVEGTLPQGDERCVMYIDHVTMPFNGYAFHIKNITSTKIAHGRIILSISEGYALNVALTSAMGHIAFG